MQIDRRITNGLAWAGVVLVVGIPLADLVTGQLMGDGPNAATAQIAMIEPVAAVAPVPVPLSQRPAAPVVQPVAAVPVTAPVVAPAAPAAPVQTAAVAPVAAKPAAQATGQGDIVDGYLQSGRALPSYITGAGAPASTPQPPVASAPAAAVPPAPTPAGAPATVAVAPVQTDPVVTAALTPAKVAPMPMPLSMRPEPVLIVEGATRTRAIQVGPGLNPRSSATVTYGDLQDWESGPLSEFLARRQGVAVVPPDYDEDGFFLDEGPNGPRRGDRLIGPVVQPVFPFVN
ncbi:hypothetical protein [Devosia beringensis]|uniref:hypothetical protein n=1 Tax=Devosia beringensis TaxID=2657486 RepID=UPI00186B7692|nr:hypothetical protein [Devosia beringensis]